MDAWVSLKMGHFMSFQWGTWWHSSLSDKPIYCTQYKKSIGTISLQLSTFIAANIFVGHVFWALGRLPTSQAGLQCGRLGTHRTAGWERERLIARSLLSRGADCADGIIWDPPWCSSWSFFSGAYSMLLIGLIGVPYFQLRFSVLRL